jgi:superfamily II DNA or RNA helicase
MPMLRPGEYAYDKLNNERVQILAVNEVWGFVSYKVLRLSDESVCKLTADALTTDSSGVGSGRDENYIRYVALLSKIKNETSGGILSKLSNGIIPLPHQRYVLERAIEGNNIRYILADEVGLGKTIEAGLIIKELKARGLIKRILVVCPTGLVTQWSLEMREKFGETFHAILPDEYATIRKITESEDVYGGFDQVISPMDSIKPMEKHIGRSPERIEKYNEERIYSVINSGWDLVVIDEAHRVAGSSGEVARHKLGSLLAAASPYLLLLTATPHNGKTEPFLRLIRLIDEEAFPNYNAIVKEQVAPYVIRTEKREAIDNSGNRLFKNRTTKAVSLTWDERHTLQRKLYETVTRYVSKSYNKAMRRRGKNMWFIFLLIMMQRLVSSSTSAIRESMERRIRVLEQQEMQMRSISEDEFAAMELEMSMEEAMTAMSLDIKEEISELTELVTIAKQAEYQYLDVKIEPLLTIVDDLFTEERNRKVIIFTEFIATQSYLAELLIRRGYKICKLNGSMSIDARNDVLDVFRNESDIMISTDAGGEGLNLQFSNCVINYDLPWNPMKIEQRIGRVDRIGQQRDVIAYNLILTDTIESHVREVLEEKLNAILKELGVDKYADVLDGEQAEVNYTDAYMRSIRDPKNTKYATNEVENDFKRQVNNTLKIRDLITEDKDLSALVGVDTGFDLDASLRLMLVYYENSMGNPILPIDNYSITDPVITKHLNRELEFTPDNPLTSVSIKDFPNEPGYFMLWELSVSDDEQSRRFIPVFVNEVYILRPIAGRKIWDAILDERSILAVSGGASLPADIYERLATISRDYAYDSFVALKDETVKRRKETHRKHMYALKLRIEAAERIDIENIKRSKLMQLAREKAEAERTYELTNVIFPEFRPVMIVKMEGGNAS